MVMADCPYTKIAVMQLFYELKQKFPTIPDQVVTDFIQQASYNKEECEKKLREEYERFQLHSYPADIVNKMTEGKGRPKTLPLAHIETNTSTLFGGQSKKICDEEQGRTGCVIQNAIDDNSYIARSMCEKLERKTADHQHVEVSNISESVKNVGISDEQSTDISVCDLNVQVQNEKLDFDQSRLRVEYKKGMSGISHSAPTTPSTQKSMNECATSKHRSSLNVDQSNNSSTAPAPKRPSTTVMLTIRPPSTLPQPPVNISTNGSNLLYSTGSYNPNAGYTSQLQISISEEGNTTVTAFRKKTNSNIPDKSTEELDRRINHTFPALFHNALSSSSELRLSEQKKRKSRLEEEYRRDKQKLMQIQQEVRAMEKDLERREKAPFISEKVLRLRKEVTDLRNECAKMYRELELAEGQITQLLSEDNGNWTCHLCTFKNHPMLPKCEQCEMARVDLTNTLPSLLRPPVTSTQLPAIHPRV